MTDGQITALASRHAAEIIDFALEVGAWTHDDLPGLTVDDYERVMAAVRRITIDLVIEAGEDGNRAWLHTVAQRDTAEIPGPIHRRTINRKEDAWGEPPARHT